MKIGKYEILEEIGSGGMGVVYKAHDPVLGRDVAIKVILDKMMDAPEIRERFYHEARSLGKHLHENLTIVHDVGEFEDKPYIVMEYLAGRDLRSVINAKAPLRLMEKLDYTRQICKGFEFVHAKNIIHRDIKPENIKILDDSKVKILDFGIAKAAASSLTRTGARIGTPWYMSPEQINGKVVDRRSDIFSFGVLFYELLAYKRPFDGDDTAVMYQIVHEEPQPLNIEEQDVTGDLQAVIGQCLAKEAQDRYADFTAIIQDLDRIIATVQRNEKTRVLLAEGKALMAQQRFTEAISRFDEILRIDPASADGKSLRKECVEKEKQLQTMRVLTGDIVGETVSHYRILERLGAGGMGIVYKAEDTKLKRPVALKFLLLELTRDASMTQRFIREARAVSALDHPNICSIHEIDELDGGQLFICMAYYEGETLRAKMSTSRLEIAEALDIAIQVARGLAKAHEQGVVHRDVKPANIIITKDDTVKIVDFGLAKLAGATRLTKTGTSIGTLIYMSPEQVKGMEVDHRIDVWALGVILYEMLTGQQPFKGEQELAILYLIVNEEPASASQLNPSIPSAIVQIIKKALQKQAANRFSSMQDMLEALQQAQQTTSGAKDQASSEAKSEILNLTAKGRLLLSRNELGNALSRFKAVLELDPYNQEARQLIGECERRQDELLEIGRLLSAGRRSFEKGEFNEAVKNFQDILAIAPEQREAKEFIEKIRKISEQTEAVAKLLADAEFYMKRERFDQAIEIYKKVLNLDPANKNALRGLQKVQKGRDSLISLEAGRRATTPISPPEFGSKNLWKWAGVGTIAVAGLIAAWVLLYDSKSETKIDRSGPATIAKQALDSIKTETLDASAETWAAVTYQNALQTEQNGDQEFARGNYPAAQQNYETAATTLKSAAEEARRNKTLAETNVNRLKDAVGAMRRDMIREKSAAERAGAKTLAAASFEAALRQEQEGERFFAAGGMEDMRGAQRSYGAAHEGYKAARTEVGRIAVARAKTDADDANSRMSQAKQRLVGRGTDLNKSPQYAKAAEAEKSAARSYRAGDFRSARTSFDEAAKLYQQTAEGLAKSVVSPAAADAAKTAMLTAKGKVDQSAFDEAKYQQASKSETEADAAYAQENFDKAAERYQAAEALYTTVAREAEKFVVERQRMATAQREIQSLIAMLEASLENKDLQGLKTLYEKTFTRADDKSWSNFFKIAENIEIGIESENPTINSKNAEVALSIQVEYTNNKGERQPPQKFKEMWKLEEINGKWSIIEVTH